MPLYAGFDINAQDMTLAALILGVFMAVLFMSFSQGKNPIQLRELDTLLKERPTAEPGRGPLLDEGHTLEILDKAGVRIMYSVADAEYGRLEECVVLSLTGRKNLTLRFFDRRLTSLQTGNDEQKTNPAITPRSEEVVWMFMKRLRTYEASLSYNTVSITA